MILVIKGISTPLSVAFSDNRALYMRAQNETLPDQLKKLPFAILNLFEGFHFFPIHFFLRLSNRIRQDTNKDRHPKLFTLEKY